MTMADRRATPRLEVLGQLHGYLVSLEVSLVVRDLSAGGFSVESVVPFPPGARHPFRFTASTGMEITVEAVVMHSRPHGLAGGQALYVTGFAFCHDSEHYRARAVDDLLGALASARQFR
jgi:hypothetical protein